MMMKKLFLPLALLSCLLATPAHADENVSISCQTTSSLKNGVRLIYDISGQITLNDDGTLQKTNELFIRIVRRERNGQEKYLYYQEKLGDWLSDAPDADNTNLANRFSRSFKSEAGSLLYVPSAENGIYIGLSYKRPFRIQVVHLMNKSLRSSVKSDISQCSLSYG
ncbi:MAG TPA: hypothetical protein VK184_22780 [Nostocaceae cyanobacterium]|nr:hypothetical protein [Nostocaceae cyanobacterium]